MGKVGIVVVNWNGWGDTLECLEAIFRLEEFDGPVVVCDNDSKDGSLEIFCDWAEGKLCSFPEGRSDTIRDLTVPPVEKPIKTVLLKRGDRSSAETAWSLGARLWLVKMESNAGFAGGNNVGLELLSAVDSVELFWLLNSDALPKRNALKELVRLSEAVDGPLITGSVLLEYWRPNEVQACGASFNRYLATVVHLYEGAPASRLADLPSQVEVDYPIGASLAVNRAFLNQVGPMSTEYFLYFEEIDWVVRSRLKHRPVIVTGSHVFHKGGGATKAGRAPAERNLFADYCYLRGRVILASKMPIAKRATIIVATVVSLAKRIVRRRPGAFRNALSALSDGFALRSKLK